MFTVITLSTLNTVLYVSMLLTHLTPPSSRFIQDSNNFGVKSRILALGCIPMILVADLNLRLISLTGPVLHFLLGCYNDAFNRLEWSYLLAVLRRFGFVSFLIHIIETFYSHSMHLYWPYSIVSSQFCLQKGTRQGCPLSPILFALLLNSLA